MPHAWTPFTRFLHLFRYINPCRPARNLITLNLKLLFLHPAYGDYVLLHEYCHYRVLNHSADFYRELERVCPHHAEARKYLNRAVIPPLPR